MPHLLVHGEICYRRNDSVLLARDRPAEITCQALQAALEVLERGLSGANRAELLDEWGTLWASLPQQGQLVIGKVAPGSKPRRLFTAFNPFNLLPLIQVAARKEELTGFPLPIPVLYNGLLVPLREDVVPESPPSDGCLTLDWVRSVIHRCTHEADRCLVNRLVNSFQATELILFSLPRPSGGAVLFGVLCDQITEAHPLRRNGRCATLQPVNVIRMDEAFLLPRSGADPQLRSARVAVLGCGSVGSMVAVELARAGVGRLELVDHDRLLPENLYRHALGLKGAFLNKAEALAFDLLERFPALQVTPHPHDLFNLTENPGFPWSGCDAVVVATGHPSLELHLNEFFHRHRHPRLAVYSWVEPYGLGGHALLTRPGVPSVPGCLQCLHTDPQSHTLVANRASFSDSTARVDLDLAGCGGQFTPYGGLHASRTALLATQLLLDGLRHEVVGCPLVSWKGSALAYRGQGFANTLRYDLSEEQLEAGARDYVQPDCPICGAR